VSIFRLRKEGKLQGELICGLFNCPNVPYSGPKPISTNGLNLAIMEKTQHAHVMPSGTLTLYKNWDRVQLLTVAEETVNFMNRILKSVEWERIQGNERIIKQKLELNSFYLKTYDEQSETEFLFLSNGIDWSTFKNCTVEDSSLSRRVKKMSFYFYVSDLDISRQVQIFDCFEIFIPEEKEESVKKSIMRLVEISRKEKNKETV
jgi:hypothetical protein